MEFKIIYVNLRLKWTLDLITDEFTVSNYFYFKEFLDINMSDEEFLQLLQNFNGEYADFWACFESKSDAEKFKEHLDTYLIMKRLTE